MPATVIATGREQAGIVLSKRGKVTAKATGQEPRILKRGDPIYSDDLVHTVRGANVQLKMQDRNIVMLRGGCAIRDKMYRSEGMGNGQRFEYVGGILRESRREPVQLLDLGISA